MSKKSQGGILLAGFLALTMLPKLLGQQTQPQNSATIAAPVVTPQNSTETTNRPINPYASPQLAPTVQFYTPTNTSMGDLQANINWAMQQGFRLIRIEGPGVDGDSSKYRAYMER